MGKARVVPGGSDEPVLIMASSNTQRTRIVSRKIMPNNLTEANKLFLYRGRDGQEACIMVQPMTSTCLCYEAAICCPIPFLSVPSGPIVLWQKCGTNQGALNPGCQPCWCGWNRVSHLVSKQLVTYNHMPKKCPTRDHVFVDIDLSVTLKINSSQVNKFVFEMGVERLDAYLSFQVEESIRGLVYDVNHDRVNDLRSEFASDMLAVLQQKVERFGVDIKAVKITNVALPRELQERLESTTAFKTRLTGEAKNHEHVLQTIENGAAQRRQNIEQTFVLEKRSLRAESDRADTEQQEKLAVAKSDRATRSTKALEEQDLVLTRARSDLEVAEFTGRTEKADLVESTKIDCERRLREARKECSVETTASEASKVAAIKLAEAREAEASAEGRAAELQEQKIRYEQKLRLADLDAVFAARGRHVIQGPGGASILSAFHDARGHLAPAPQAIKRE